MKDSRRSSTDTINSLWKNFTTGIQNKVKKSNISNSKIDEERDMGDTHTPVSRLDLTGLNREQAKDRINKIIDERLEMISQIELSELKIDHGERERQRAEAAERINERRSRRKSRDKAPAEMIVTAEGVYSDYRQESIFDIIQPEEFPFEGEAKAEPVSAAEPLEGQLSLLDALEKEDKPYEDSGFDFFGLLEYDLSKEGDVQEESGQPLLEGIRISTALDEALDKVFAFYEKGKARILPFRQSVHSRISAFVKDKAVPAASAGWDWTKNKVTPLLQRADSRLHFRSRAAVVCAVLAKGEKKTSEKMARFVEFMDRRNEALICTSIAFKEKVCHCFNLMRAYVEHHRKKFLIGFGAAVGLAAAITIVIGNMTAYEYIYNGKVLGVVKNQEDVYKTIDVIGDRLSVQYDADITINKEKDIRFKKVIAFDQDIDDREDILNRLTYMRDMKANGHGIYVDGKLVAVLDSSKTAKAILSEIQDKYVKDDANIQYKSVDFAENVTIQDVETKLGNIEKKEKALEYMLTGAVEKKIHVVQSGETFSEIAKTYGMKQSELSASNPDVIPEKLSIGQEICLNQIVPLVTVQTTEVAQYKETIPYEIKYENTANLFKNEQTVKSKGTNGEKDVVAEIVRNNGIEVSRKEISSTVLSEPVSQVVLVGTKDPPPLIGTGKFIYPIRGTLTSRYGTRWGRLHAGIDLAAPIGTQIKAADGGKVTFAGYNGALGYMVEIDHGGGRVTWYGHCSKLFVKKGDRVYQGQHIANVGNTGRSTGPHVHFEVHINGKTKNPLNYL